MLSDEDGKVIRLYGVAKEEGTGAKRSVFVLDTAGRIVHVNPKYEVSNPMHYKAVLDALRQAK
jgi:peroxiredoxin